MTPRLESKLFLDRASKVLRPPIARERIRCGFDETRVDQIGAAGYGFSSIPPEYTNFKLTCQHYLVLWPVAEFDLS